MVQQRVGAARMRSAQVGPGPGAAIGEGLQNLGDVLLEVNARNKKNEDITRGEEIIQDLAFKIAETEERIRPETDHNSYLRTWQQEVGNVKREILGGFRGFTPEVKSRYAAEVERLFGTRQREALREQSKRALDFNVAEGKRALEGLAKLAAEDPNPEERVRAQQRGFERIGGLKDDGYITHSMAVDWVATFKKNVQEGRQRYFDADLTKRLDDLQNRALREPDVAGSLDLEGVRIIDNATKDWLPKDKRDEAVDQFKSTLWSSAVKGMIENDPAKAKHELAAGKYDSVLSQSHLLALRGEADAEVDRRQRKAEAERKEVERRIGKQVDDFKTAVMSGFPWAGNAAELRQRVKGTEHEKEFLETARDANELWLFGQMGPAEQENYLRVKSQGAKTGSEASLYGKLETAHTRTKAALKDDPMTFAIKQRVLPSLMPFDITNPASMKERSIAAGIVEQRYNVSASPLSDEEADSLSQTLSNAAPDQQVQIFKQLRQGFEDRHIKAVAGQLAKKKNDPVLAHAMGLSLEAPEAASRILRGRQIIRDNREVLPQGVDMRTAQNDIASALAESFQHNPEHYRAVSDAAMAIYAFKSWQQRDLSGAVDTGRMDEAIKEASGGVITLGSFGSRYTVQAPRYGATEDDFRDLLERADYSKAQGMKADDIKKHGIFESIGDGRYLVRIGPGYVQSERGPFILDLGSIPPRGMTGATIGGIAKPEY